MVSRRRRTPPSTASGDLAAIALLAPMVASRRMLALAMAPLAPASAREARRMLAEKPAAAADAFGGAWMALLQWQASAWWSWWSAPWTPASWPRASARHADRLARAALAPVARRVRANARRLGKPGRR